jgi:hypothetical protein
LRQSPLVTAPRSETSWNTEIPESQTAVHFPQAVQSPVSTTRRRAKRSAKEKTAPYGQTLRQKARVPSSQTATKPQTAKVRIAIPGPGKLRAKSSVRNEAHPSPSASTRSRNSGRIPTTSSAAGQRRATKRATCGQANM